LVQTAGAQHVPLCVPVRLPPRELSVNDGRQRR
jgi:hypothetical protein